MYKYAVRTMDVSIEKIGESCGRQKDLTTKDTKEHKGEYEAWRQPESYRALLDPTGSFLPEFAFVFLGALCRYCYLTNSSRIFAACWCRSGGAPYITLAVLPDLSNRNMVGTAVIS